MDGNDVKEEIKLSNETPELITTTFYQIQWFVESFGWLILIAVVAVIYLYNKYAPTYHKWKQQRQDVMEAEILKKDPDKAYQMQVSVEQARMRLQEKVREDAKRRKEILDKKEEEKRKNKIEEWDNHVQGKGYHSKYKLDKPEESTGSGHIKGKKPLRSSDFNPLMGGSSGSGGYRPSRRNVSGGG